MSRHKKLKKHINYYPSFQISLNQSSVHRTRPCVCWHKIFFSLMYICDLNCNPELIRFKNLIALWYNWKLAETTATLILPLKGKNNDLVATKYWGAISISFLGSCLHNMAKYSVWDSAILLFDIVHFLMFSWCTCLCFCILPSWDTPSVIYNTCLGNFAAPWKNDSLGLELYSETRALSHKKCECWWCCCVLSHVPALN